MPLAGILRPGARFGDRGISDRYRRGKLAGLQITLTHFQAKIRTSHEVVIGAADGYHYANFFVRRYSMNRGNDREKIAVSADENRSIIIETIAHTTGPGRSQEKKKNPRPPKRAWDPTVRTAGAVLLLSLFRLLFARKNQQNSAKISTCRLFAGTISSYDRSGMMISSAQSRWTPG